METDSRRENPQYLAKAKTWKDPGREGFQRAANCTRAGPKDTLPSRPLDSALTGQVAAVFSQSLTVFLKMAGKGKEKDLVPSTWVGLGFSL